MALIPERVWTLPSVAVSKVFSHLTWQEKLCTTEAICFWEQHLHDSEAWPLLDYAEDGYTKLQDRLEVSKCICRYGRYIQCIKLQFYHGLGRNGTQVFKDIAFNCVMLKKLQTCRTIWNSRATKVYGEILQNCSKLRTIALIQPVLVWGEGSDENVIVLITKLGHAPKVVKLQLTGASLVEHEGPLTMLRSFTNLNILKVRREELPEELLMELVGNKLVTLSLFQDEEIPLEHAMLYTAQLWQDVLGKKAQFELNLILRNIVVLRSIFPAYVPMRAIVLVDLSASLTKGILDTIADCYHKTLQIFVYTKSYVIDCAGLEDKRLPVALTDLVTKCHRLHTLVYGFEISSTTALLIAKTRPLCQFSILGEDLSFQFDWQIQEDWSKEFVDWLHSSGASLDSLESAVSELFGYEWRIATEFHMWQHVNYYTNI